MEENKELNLINECLVNKCLPVCARIRVCIYASNRDEKKCRADKNSVGPIHFFNLSARLADEFQSPISRTAERQSIFKKISVC